MNKKHLTLALSGAIAFSLLAAAPSIQAGENPFGMSTIHPIQLTAADEKAKEGKCGEGKCGGDKTKAAEGKQDTTDKANGAKVAPAGK